MVKAKIIITVKAGFRDPQREALEERLRQGGDELAAPTMPAAQAVPAGLRTGRYVEFLLDTDDVEAARRQAEDFCRRRLINEVLEAFTCEIEPLSN
ncbi:hypothetical protein GTO91_12310 [Heliobacterium undosum]|uniref:Phosphoribosylformylglycinamidine synthase n=1 Tax=Heliomicrobium undosum TaxID=121734 RepID=A0A845L1U1_9FIRM|nr:phosphoribosylformylglycinamidine synthase subunit PurS [Heliomicrobium undosum]MZP30497.1 hypothetical protein [Heliomicrobium undosum]